MNAKIMRVLKKCPIAYNPNGKTLEDVLFEPKVRELVSEVEAHKNLDFKVSLSPQYVCYKGLPIRLESSLRFGLKPGLFSCKVQNVAMEIGANSPILDFPYNPAEVGLSLRRQQDDKIELTEKGINPNLHLIHLLNAITQIQLKIPYEGETRLIDEMVNYVKNELEDLGYINEPSDLIFLELKVYPQNSEIAEIRLYFNGTGIVEKGEIKYENLIPVRNAYFQLGKPALVVVSVPMVFDKSICDKKYPLDFEISHINHFTGSLMAVEGSYHKKHF